MVAVKSDKNSDIKTLDQQLLAALEKLNPEVITLNADENGHAFIDKDLHPELYDWAVNG